MAEIQDGTTGGGPAASRQSPAEAEASFRAKVRALRAIRGGWPAGRAPLAEPQAFRPAPTTATRPWAF